MKKIQLKNLALLTVAVIMLSNCGGLNKMKETASSVNYSVTPEVLEMHGGQVDVTITTKYPGKYFNKKAIVVATPVLTYSGGQEAFDSVTFQGEAVEANYTTVPFEGGKTDTYNGTIPYNEDMMKSELKIQAYAKLKDTKVDFPPVKIADGVIATPSLVEIDPKPILVGDKFERIIPEDYEADIHYVISRSYVRRSELSEEDIKSLEEKIAMAKEDERKEFKGASISAYASPDGPLDFNDELSEDRSGSAEKYFKETLKKAEIEQAEGDEFFSLMTTAEDWEGFKELMEASDIQDKELILRVLSMYSDPVVREKEIRNISEAFEEIKDKILPKLRRSKLKISVDKIGYSDEELLTLVEENPDTLKLEEILYAASLLEDLDKKLAAYQKASENFPKCFRAKNNVGYVYVKMGNVEEAKAAFEEAKELKDNDVINNNLGVVALMEGDKEKAEELFTSAMGAGEVVNYNLGIIKVIDGDYEAAVNYFGNVCETNAALAEMLNGANDEALSTLNCVEDDDAMVYYLKAVIGARTDNSDMLFSNLRTAVGKDASLKAHAQKDMEFAKFMSDETFQSIVAE